jgi:hypothetical protein
MRTFESDRTLEHYGADSQLMPEIKLVHSASQWQIENLGDIFAKLTPNGWAWPHWVAVMHSRCE